MKLIFCLTAVAVASPFMNEFLEARAEPNALGQSMGAMAGPVGIDGANGASTRQPSSQRGRPTLSSLLEKLDTLLGGAIAARDLGDMEELEELIARANIEGGVSSSFRSINRTPVNHYPVRKPSGGKLPEGIRPKFRIGESVKPESLMGRDMLDDELWF